MLVDIMIIGMLIIASIILLATFLYYLIAQPVDSEYEKGRAEGYRERGVEEAKNQIFGAMHDLITETYSQGKPKKFLVSGGAYDFLAEENVKNYTGIPIVEDKADSDLPDNRACRAIIFFHEPCLISCTF